MKLIEGFDSNYRFVLVAARRARQIQSGARPMVTTASRKPCRIAQDEVLGGKVPYITEPVKSPAAIAAELLEGKR